MYFDSLQSAFIGHETYLVHIKSGYIPHFTDEEDKVMYPRVDS